MARREVLLQTGRQAVERTLFFGKSHELQYAAHAVDHATDGFLGVELEVFPETFRFFARRHRQVTLGNHVHDGPASEHFLLIDNRIMLGTRRDEGLAVAGLDRHRGAFAPRLDQQPRIGLVAGREQKSAQHGDDDGGDDRQPELTTKNEEQS